jgi:hypothetical protein
MATRATARTDCDTHTGGSITSVCRAADPVLAGVTFSTTARAVFSGHSPARADRRGASQTS